MMVLCCFSLDEGRSVRAFSDRNAPLRRSGKGRSDEDRFPPLRSGGGLGWGRCKQYGDLCKKAWKGTRLLSRHGLRVVARFVAPPPQPSPVSRGRGSSEIRFGDLGITAVGDASRP